MDVTTFWIYIVMYVYGFSLTLWAIFLDKHPTSRTLKGAKFGLTGLIITLFYFAYVLWKFGLT